MVVTDAIVVVPTHGFANRLRMVASCVVLGQKLCIPVKICWIKNSDCNIGWKDIFKSTEWEEISLPTVTRSRSYHFYGDVHTQAIMGKILRIASDTSVRTRYIVLKGGHEFLPGGYSAFEFLKCKHAFYKSLEFTDTLQKKFETKMAKVSKPYVAVHVRQTMNPDIADQIRSDNCKFEQNSSVESFKQLVKKLNAAMPIVCVTNKPQIDWSTSFGRPVYTVSDKHCNRFLESGMVASILDFMVLVHADVIIGSFYSSFSDEASFFRMVSKVIPLSQEKRAKHFDYHCFNFSTLHGFYGLNLSSKSLLTYFV